MDTRTPPSFALVIEWENATLCAEDRPQRMLAALAAQLAALAPDASWELAFLHDSRLVDMAAIRAALAAQDPGLAARARFIPAPAQTYYQLKNLGARSTAGEIIVFLDSDVIPEPGWLGRMLAAFDDPRVDALSGNCYVEPSSFLGRVFNLCWFFDPRTTGDRLLPHHRFVANNFAIRRRAFERFPFEGDVAMRAQCVQLARRLRDAGMGLYLHEGAHVAHPPPNGFAGLLAHALCEGEDAVRMDRVRQGRSPWRASWWRLRTELARSAERLRTSGAEVGLSRRGRVLGLLAAASYYYVLFGGECMARLHPRLLSRLFRA